MFKKKKKSTPGSKPKTGIRRLYNFHTKEPMVFEHCLEPEPQGWHYGAFIDVGIRNMSIRLSRGRPADKQIEGLLQVKYDYDLSKGNKFVRSKLETKSRIGLEEDKYSEMLQCFIRHRDELSLCQYIVIEQQIRGATLNLEVMNKLIGMLSVLVTDRGNRPIIVEIDSNQKSVPLGGPRSISSPKGLKDWCYFKSLEILKINNSKFDLELLETMLTLKKYGKNKRDDHADTICYCYVWWHHYVFNDKLKQAWEV